MKKVPLFKSQIPSWILSSAPAPSATKPKEQSPGWRPAGHPPTERGAHRSQRPWSVSAAYSTAWRSLPCSFWRAGKGMEGRQQHPAVGQTSEAKDIQSLSFLPLTLQVLQPLFRFSGARIRNNRAVISQSGCRRAAVFQASIVLAQMPLTGHKGSLDLSPWAPAPWYSCQGWCCWHLPAVQCLRAVTPRPSEQGSVTQQQLLHALLLSVHSDFCVLDAKS